MPHTIDQKIGAVRRRARRLVWLYGVSRAASVLLAAAAALALADYLVHFQDRGIRLMASTGLLAVAVWACVRFLAAGLRTRLSDVQIAQRIERRFPQLQDRLASSVEFLRQREDDPLAGSAALRKAVVAQTSAEVERLDLDRVIEPRPVYRTALAAGLTAALVLIVAALNPTIARIALARLFLPLSDAAWPQVHHLQFIDPPHRLALGQPFEVQLQDASGAPLPDDVTIHYRYQGEGQAETETSEAMRYVDKRMVAHKDNVSRSFAYRASGGDDDSMPWIELQVIEPPAVDQIGVVLHYPEYTGWPDTACEQHIRALTGTRVEISAHATKPLRSAALHVDDGPTIAGDVSDDGCRFTIPAAGGPPFLIERTGSYWFELTDRDGIQGGPETRYEIRAVEDVAPSVVIESPGGNSFVTAAAEVPLRVAVKDDLAIHRVALHYSRSDRTEQGEQSETLYEGPQRVERRTGAAAVDETRLGDSRTIEHRWRLGPLSLKPGTQVTLYATAVDYRPLVGQSHARRLTIITPDELQERLAERQNFIVAELVRILKLERVSRSAVSGLEIQFQQVGRFSKQDVDHLQGAELIQRQAERGLISPTEGVTTQIAGLLADLSNNKVDSPEVERHMQRLLTEIERLGSDELPVIGRELTSALKSAQADAEAPAAAGRSLSEAGRHQDEVIQSLEQLLGDLAQWDNYRRFHREIGQLHRDQQEVERDTSALGRQTLSRDFKDLDSQQQADLKKLGSRQLELARRFDTIRQRMERMAAELEARDPLASGTISDALQQARESAVAGAMRAAGGQVQENQVGQAAAGQRQAAEGLQDMLDILANRRTQELARLVRKLREAEEKLSALRSQQEGLRKKWAAAAGNPDEKARRRELERLAREQRELQREVERFARNLQRLQAEKAARNAARGGDQMGQAGQRGEEGQGAAAAEAATAAERDLDDAQQQLAKARRQAEVDLADEQLARLEDGLKALHARQQKLVEETRHYDDLARAQGELTRAQAIGVGDLAREERTLEDETVALAKKLTAAVVFELGLRGAAREMGHAADRLDARETGPPTQQALERALARLEQLLEALKPEKLGDKAANKQDGGNEGDGGQGGQPPGDAIRMLSELKLLKLMQDQINLRTRALDDALGRKQTLTPDERREYAELSEEQGQIADLLLELSQPDEEVPEDDPENLPDMELKDTDPKDAEPKGMDPKAEDEMP